MKRLISLLLCVALVLSLGACTKKPSQTAAPETTAPAAAEAPTEAPVSAEDAVGSYENGVYRNEMLGIQAAFDENWYVASVEERLEVVGAVSEVVTDEAIADMLETSGTAMDLYAIQASGNNVNLMLQKINFLQNVLISEQEYVNQSLPQMDAAMKSIQVEDAVIEATTITFAGGEHPAIAISGTQGGLNFYELMVVVKSGSYLGIVTAACYVENTTEEILGLFEGL